MKIRNMFFYGCMAVVFLLSACQKDEVNKPGGENTYTYTFEKNTEEWVGDFADYFVGEDDRFELSFRRTSLPDPLDQSQMALEISGRNLSDDLFMFIKRRITGLKPGAAYQLFFDIELASNAPENSVGIGGSPGSSVYLKAGATRLEPLAVKEGEDWAMNIDKGNQSQGGEDMIVLGHVGTDKEEFEYTLISRNNADTPFSITADDNGELWVIIGTDSGFEGATTLYYNRIELSFQEIME